MGQWRLDAVKSVEQNLFWVVMEICSLCRRPLDHFIHILQKKRHGSEEMNSLACLTHGKAEAIMNELQAGND